METSLVSRTYVSKALAAFKVSLSIAELRGKGLIFVLVFYMGSGIKPKDHILSIITNLCVFMSYLMPQ